MKTRIIQTRFWDDEFVSNSDLFTQHLYIYLLTSQYINISGIFQLPTKKIMMEASLTENQFNTAKENLEKADKVKFFNGWVYVINSRKNNNYESYEGNRIACQREMSQIPLAVREAFGVVDEIPEDVEKKTYKRNEGGLIHRQIAEKVLGRKLTEDEDVHHIDRDTKNNKVENLAVVSKKDHIKIHKGELKLNDTSVTLLSEYSDSEYSLPINNKQEIIKERVVKGKQTFGSIASITPEVIKEIAERYHCSTSFVNVQFEKMKNWLEGSGKVKKDYKATLRNFVLSELERTGRGGKIEIGNGSTPILTKAPEMTEAERIKAGKKLEEIRKQMHAKGVIKTMPS